MNNDFNNEFNTESNSGFENNAPQMSAPEENSPKYAADFRRAARNALAGRWGIAVVAYLLYMALAFACVLPMLAIMLPIGIVSSVNGGEIFLVLELIAFVVYVITIVAMLLISPALSVGYARFNLDLYGEGESQIGSLFFGFKKCFGKALKVTLLVALRALIGMAVIFAGGIAFMALLGTEIPTLVLLGALVMILSYFVGLILMIVIMLKYVLVPTILADDPTLSASEAVRRSAELMRGNRIRYVLLNLSFIGWYLLASCCGFGMVVLIPYMSAANTSFYLALKREKGEREAPEAGPRSLEDYFILE